MGILRGVCLGSEPGKIKKNVHQANAAKDFGLSGDCRQGFQASLKLVSGSSPYREAEENLLVEGILSQELRPGTKLLCNDVLLELTEGEGDTWHCRVIYGGVLTEGDTIDIQ